MFFEEKFIEGGVESEAFSQSSKTPTILVIKDAEGRLVHSEEVKYPIQIFALNTSNWASGTYLYELRSDKELMDNGKIEVTH